MHEGPAAFAPALDCVCCGSAVTCRRGVCTRLVPSARDALVWVRRKAGRVKFIVSFSKNRRGHGPRFCPLCTRCMRFYSFLFSSDFCGSDIKPYLSPSL